MANDHGFTSRPRNITGTAKEINRRGVGRIQSLKNDFRREIMNEAKISREDRQQREKRAKQTLRQLDRTRSKSNQQRIRNEEIKNSTDWSKK